MSISDRLRARELFGRKRPQFTAFDVDAKDMIDKAVRRVVLLLRGLELYNVATREEIEEMVILAFERSEFLYYGVDKATWDWLTDKEIENDKRRANIK